MQSLRSGLRQKLYGLSIVLALLVLGLCIYKDYGVSWDENSQRLIGYTNLQYVLTGDEALMENFVDKDHGAAYELPLTWLETTYAAKDYSDGIHLRHACNFLLYLAGIWCGYLLAYRLFKKEWIALLGMALLVIQPRIFAHAFFNSKDVPFLAAMLIGLYAVHVAIGSRRIWPYLLAGAACGFATGIRTMGALLIALSAGAMLIDVLRPEKAQGRKPVLQLAGFLLAAAIVLFVSWPALWSDPFGGLSESLSNLSRFTRFEDTTLFNGTTYASGELPWYYAIEWFLISMPVMWSVLGLIGCVAGIRMLIRRRKGLLASPKARTLLICAGLLYIPFIAVIALDSVLYDDWRHLYFIYPAFVMIALYGVERMTTRPRAWNVVAILIAVQALLTGLFMIGAHPFQHVYFNAFVPHRAEYLRRNFDYEYWGTSNKQALAYVLAHDQRDSVPVAWTDYALMNNAGALPPEQRARVKLVPKDAPGAYLLTNYRFHPEDYPYQKIWGLKVGGSTVVQVYRIPEGVR